MRVGLPKVAAALSRPPSRVELPERGRRAAVAAILTPDLELVLLRRAEHPGDPWSGHVSFPGGRVEHGETTLQAAIRETHEEIGVDLGSAQLLGPLDELRTAGHLPPLVIHPYVFALSGAPSFALNGEVASVHRIGLDRLLRGEGRGAMRRTFRDAQLTLPHVDFEGGRLWGLTLHMVDDLLDRLDGRGRGLARSGLVGDQPWDGARSV